MEHVYGQTCEQIGMCDGNDYKEDACKEFKKIEKEVECLAKSANIIYTDIHNGNIIINKEGKIYLIDFSPEYIVFNDTHVAWENLVKINFPKLTKGLNQKLSILNKRLLQEVKQKIVQFYPY